MTKVGNIINIQLSEKFKEAVKEEFKNINCCLELIINQGGIRDGKIELKIK
ncbi:MAG: hypothetical protein WA066_03045 [Candidatus Omnitrophota bacterium]